MPYYRYKAASSDGDVISGFIRADNESDATDTLSSRDFRVTELSVYQGSPADLKHVICADRKTGKVKSPQSVLGGALAAIAVLFVLVVVGATVRMWPESNPDPKPTETAVASGPVTVRFSGNLFISEPNAGIRNPFKLIECTFHYAAPSEPIIRKDKSLKVNSKGVFSTEIVVPNGAKRVDVVLHLQGGKRDEFDKIPIIDNEVQLPAILFKPGAGKS